MVSLRFSPQLLLWLGRFHVSGAETWISHKHNPCFFLGALPDFRKHMCTHTFSYNSPQLYMHLVAQQLAHTPRQNIQYLVSSHTSMWKRWCQDELWKICTLFSGCTVNAGPSRLHQISVLLSGDNRYSYKKDFVRDTCRNGQLPLTSLCLKVRTQTSLLHRPVNEPFIQLCPAVLMLYKYCI